jgi:hypothetical protein
MTLKLSSPTPYKARREPAGVREPVRREHQEPAEHRVRDRVAQAEQTAVMEPQAHRGRRGHPGMELQAQAEPTELTEQAGRQAQVVQVEPTAPTEHQGHLAHPARVAHPAHQAPPEPSAPQPPLLSSASPGHPPMTARLDHPATLSWFTTARRQPGRQG